MFTKRKTDTENKPEQNEATPNLVRPVPMPAPPSSMAPAPATPVTPVTPAPAQNTAPIPAPSSQPAQQSARPFQQRETFDNKPQESAPSSSFSSSGSNFSSTTDNGKLIVGPEINLKGDIKSCDRLIVEGSVDATLHKSRQLDVAKTGTFAGTATVKIAEISGVFDGDLTVEERLYIRTNGKVTGTIAYREVEVERGGVLTGQISIIGDDTKKIDKKDK